MKRREFLAALAGAIACPAVVAHARAPKVLRLGTLSAGMAITDASRFGKTLLTALERKGFVLGRNLTFDGRGAAGAFEKLAPLVQELKSTGIDVVVSFGYPATLASRDAGLPTVAAWGMGDPVAMGLAASLAKPGGLVTGLADDISVLTTKRVALLREISPAMKHLALLWNSDDAAMTQRHARTAQIAEAAGLVVQPYGVKRAQDFDATFTAMTNQAPDGLIVTGDALTVLNIKRVFAFTAARKLPAVYEYGSHAEDGGLMSLGAGPGVSLNRAVDLCVRIFNGEKPGDLAITVPPRYPFIVNPSAARAMGIDLPLMLLALADTVVG